MDPADLNVVNDLIRSLWSDGSCESFPSLPSTQDAVRTKARAGAGEGTVCVADIQTSGRGRQGRTWEGEKSSSLLFSVLLSMHDAPVGIMPLAAGCAVAEAAAAVGAPDCQLKWPNDIMFKRRKLAGILCEGIAERPEFVVVGIGINLSSSDVTRRLGACSLDEAAGSPVTRLAMLTAVLPQLARLTRLPATDICEVWTSRAVGLGESLVVETPGATITGIAREIAPDGSLILQTQSGDVRCVAGDVHLLPATHADNSSAT